MLMYIFNRYYFFRLILSKQNNCNSSLTSIVINQSVKYEFMFAEMSIQTIQRPPMFTWHTRHPGIIHRIMRARVFVSHTPNTHAEKSTKFFGGGWGWGAGCICQPFHRVIVCFLNFKSDTFEIFQNLKCDNLLIKIV